MVLGPQASQATQRGKCIRDWEDLLSQISLCSSTYTTAKKLIQVPLGMVEGPLTKAAAAECCGCNPEGLCPGPLAGIDEGDKIRTIYAQLANDTISLRSMGCRPFIGYTRQQRMQLRPRAGGSSAVAQDLAVATAEHPVGAAQSRHHQGTERGKGAQERSGEGRMVGEQGGRVRHGQCPVILGPSGSAAAQGSLLARLPLAAPEQGSSQPVSLAVAVLANVLALGPLSWKKINTWTPTHKHILVMEVLQTMVEGQAMHAKHIEKALVEDGHHHGGEAAQGGQNAGLHAALTLQHAFRPVLPVLAKILLVGL